MYKNIYSEKNLFFDCPGGGFLSTKYNLVKQTKLLSRRTTKVTLFIKTCYLQLACQRLCFLWTRREPEKLIQTSIQHERRRERSTDLTFSTCAIELADVESDVY
jgi:hypothetical protein